MSPGERALSRLADRIATEGEPLRIREQFRSPSEGPFSRYSGDDPQFGDLAAVGTLAAADPDRYAFVVEAIREGYLCHYDRSRLLELPDPDLALLAGDLLYAIGLNELSGLDDLESTGILSDLIRIAADLKAGGNPDHAATLWCIQIVALSCGKPDDYEDLMAAIAEGNSNALDQLFKWSAETAEGAGIGSEFQKASERIHLRPSNL